MKTATIAMEVIPSISHRSAVLQKKPSLMKSSGSIQSISENPTEEFYPFSEKILVSEKIIDGPVHLLPVAVADYLVTEIPELISEVRIPYPAAAREAGIQGAVVMDLLVDASGVIREINLVEGPSYDLNQAALDAVRLFRFKPARVGREVVAVKVRYIYRFVLD